MNGDHAMRMDASAAAIAELQTRIQDLEGQLAAAAAQRAAVQQTLTLYILEKVAERAAEDLEKVFIGVS